MSVLGATVSVAIVILSFAFAVSRQFLNGRRPQALM